MRRGWRTSEFWLTIASTVGAFAIPGIPTRWSAALAAISSAAYALSRGIAKFRGEN